MGAFDFAAGQRVANFANRHALADADDAIDDWQNFSNRLQGKLQKAEFDFAKAEAARAGVARLLKQVTAELARLDPNNQLVREEVRNQIIGAGAADKFAALGYDYDVARGVIRKRD